jgi:hypothetical protein
MSRFLVTTVATLGIFLISAPSRSADLILAQNSVTEPDNRPPTAASPISGRGFSEELLGYLTAPSPLADRAGPVPSTQNWAMNNLPGHWRAPGDFVFHSLTDLKSWRFGGYAGVGNPDTLVHVIATPWNAASHHSPVYIVAGNFIYSAMELPFVPLDIELEMDLVQHFGPSSTQQFNYAVRFPVSGPLYYSPQSYQEFAIGPAFRWKWFPWNDYVYTNLRVVPIGFSYTTALSQWEALQTGLGHTAHVLNFLVAELTFAPGSTSKWESFLRVHHRSGIGGLVSNVVGGSNYVSIGARLSH